MAPSKPDLSLRPEDVTLLMHIVQNTDLSTTKWDIVNKKMALSSTAAQQRFKRLLARLKSADQVASNADGEDESNVSNNETGRGGKKRAAPDGNAGERGKRVKKEATVEGDAVDDAEQELKSESEDDDS